MNNLFPLKNLRVSLSGLKTKMSEIKQLLNEFDKVKISNRGTGACGAKTNENGKTFEDLTNNELRLISKGFTKTVYNKNKYGYYLEKNDTVFILQDGFKSYMKMKYDIDTILKPDEAYIITSDDKITLKILEKKNQNVEGSVDTKLLASHGLRCIYEYMCGERFDIEYGLCLSDWFKQHKNDDKYIYYNMFFEQHNIKVFYADESYFDNLDKWIN